MKANRIPATVRLQNRIYKMEIVEDQAWRRTRDRFYPFCQHCNITNVELSIQGDHHKGCPLRGWAKQIQHYKNLLALEKDRE